MPAHMQNTLCITYGYSNYFQVCLWGEFVNSINAIPRLWPRASAAAEVDIYMWQKNYPIYVYYSLFTISFRYCGRTGKMTLIQLLLDYKNTNAE